MIESGKTMFAQKDAGGSTRVASEKQGQEAWIF
jgi:hypothetical protein